MELKSIIIIIIAIYVGQSSSHTSLLASDASSADTSQVPSRDAFLSQLLNKNVPENSTYALAFKTNVTINKITIIQYKENGNTTIKLIDRKGITIDENKKIVVIIHGWNSSGTAQWVKDMSHAYHKIGIINTLAVDWNIPAGKGYLSAASSTREVGEVVADWLFTEILHNHSNLLANVHLVGHSLGAHVSGFMGKRFINLTGDVKVGRITGLDVAAPLFEYPIKVPSSNRFDKGDSDNIEAYHTNAGYLGFLDAVAKQDYYINYGGPIQPGCFDFSCSHSFAHLVYTKTLESVQYIALECATKLLARAGKCDDNLGVIMGERNNATHLETTFYGNTDAAGNPP